MDERQTANQTAPPRQRFLLLFEASPDSKDGRAATIRLRLLLKHALRALGFRCIDAREIHIVETDGDPEDAANAPHQS